MRLKENEKKGLLQYVNTEGKHRVCLVFNYRDTITSFWIEVTLKHGKKKYKAELRKYHGLLIIDDLADSGHTLMEGGSAKMPHFNVSGNGKWVSANETGRIRKGIRGKGISVKGEPINMKGFSRSNLEKGAYLVGPELNIIKTIQEIN